MSGLFSFFVSCCFVRVVGLLVILGRWLIVLVCVLRAACECCEVKMNTHREEAMSIGAVVTTDDHMVM